MNWLFIGLPLAGLYLAGLVYLLLKKKYNRPLLFFALAHLPYLFVNLVAPFRGLFDPNYAGYAFGWLQLPKGIWVTVVVGAMVLGCLVLISRALLDNMKGLWTFAFVFDGLLSILIALPIFLDVAGNLADFRVELGEYLQISGVWVALLVLGIFTVPTFYACYWAGKKALGGRATALA